MNQTIDSSKSVPSDDLEITHFAPQAAHQPPKYYASYEHPDTVRTPNRKRDKQGKEWAVRAWREYRQDLPKADRRAETRLQKCSFFLHSSFTESCPFYSGLKRSGLHWLELKGQCSMSRLYLPQARLAHPETFLLSLHRNAHAPFWTCGPALSLPAGPSPPAPTSHRAILFQRS